VILHIGYLRDPTIPPVQINQAGAAVDIDTSGNGFQRFRTASQFFVEHSYSKNPVKIGEKTCLIITVKDKEPGNLVSNAFVKLAIGPTSRSQFHW
jgi:hypothetical protein